MKKWFTNNLLLKVLSLILSIVLWFFIIMRGQSEISIKLPIKYKNIPKGLVINKADVNTISVNVQGQERSIENLRPEDAGIFIDMSKAKKGKTIYYIQKDDVKIPPIFIIKDISPLSIKLTLEEKTSKEITIKPVITGTPVKGYYVKGVKVSPENVVIEGAKSLLEKIVFLKTESVDVSNEDSTFEKDVKLVYNRDNIKSQSEVVRVKIILKGENR